MFINTILPGKLTLQPTMIYSSGHVDRCKEFVSFVQKLKVTGF